ncbi:hypothetical protein QQS21_009072 [Conoideocrella luteorostrata]|uniref:Zn(2)-C6 fungal-type domain-containing protein n=1 Tax=Conoideocrella luteorostrata TaxID=1105319 RepID=A0AAJ0FQS6_9HYPO|nr:hypothetical protein QQS21_009072 [Conoideocrella luteorostrata]
MADHTIEAGTTSANTRRSGTSMSRRRRRWSAKVKTGCITCRFVLSVIIRLRHHLAEISTNRARHLKCDEGKPNCGRCTSAGRNCSGYRTGATSTISTATAVRQLTDHATPFYADSTSEEKYLFHAFRVQAGHQIAGSSFLSIDVAQACHLHPAVWHSALAISAMHMKRNSRSPEHYGRVALYQYNKAIRELIQGTQNMRSGSQGQSTILLVTLLLFGVACLRGDITESRMFVGHALSLFGNWDFHQNAATRSTSGGDHAMPTSCLVALLNELFFQYSWAAQTFGPAWQLKNVTSMPALRAPLDANAAASFEFRSLQTELCELRLMRETQPSLWCTRRQIWVRRFSNWKDKFRQLRQASGHHHLLITRLHMSLICLEIFCQGDRVDGNKNGDNSSVGLSWDGLCWDRSAHQFERIIELAEQIAAEEVRTPPILGFSVGPSVIGIAYMVASFCKTHGIRNRALRLLKWCHQRDGMLDSRLLSLQAAAKIRLEEQGRNVFRPPTELARCQCIPEEYTCVRHQLVDCGAEFLENGMVKMCFSTLGSAMQPPETLSMTVPWME